MLLALLALLATLVVPSSTEAQDARGTMEVFAAVNHALGSTDLDLRRRELVAAWTITPTHPRVVYELAKVYALTKDTTAAFSMLEVLARLGTSRDPSADSAFNGLRGPRFDRAVALLRQNSAPLLRSTGSFSVPDPDLIPESVAFDAKEGVFFVGSMGKRKVLRGRPGGTFETFASNEMHGLGEVIGMKVHPKRRELWVCSFLRDSTAPRWQGFPGGFAAVFRFDLATGKLIRKHDAPRPEVAHLLNDIAFSPDGETAYVTDSHGAAVHRLRAGGELEEWYTGTGRFNYPNGIAMTEDGGRLYVAHLEGVSVWRLPDARPKRLEGEPGVPLTGIDGLYMHDGSLIAIQSTDGFEQVVRLNLSPDGLRARAAEALERRHPKYVIPTTGVVVKDVLHYVANSQLRRLGESGEVAPLEDAPETLILALPLRSPERRTPEARPLN